MRLAGQSDNAVLAMLLCKQLSDCSTASGVQRELLVHGRVVIVDHLPSVGGSVAEWLACWTQVQNSLGSNRSRDAVLGKLFTPIVPLFTKQQNW